MPLHRRRSYSDVPTSSNTKFTTPLLLPQPSATDISQNSKVVAPTPWLTYASVLLSLTIILSSLSFYWYVVQNGNIRAHQSLASLVESNGRAATLLVTVLSTFLAAILKWTLAEVFTLVSRKRFLRFRTIFEIEVWSALRNFAIIWPWGEKKMNRWAAMPMSVLLAGLSGILTSVFVTLLSPLRISLEDIIMSDAELDFSVNSSVCSDWYNKNIFIPRNRDTACQSWAEYGDFKYQRCDTTVQMLDVLEAGKASMHLFMDTLAPPRNNVSMPTYTLNRLGNTRILGSTAGVIPIGPGGINAFRAWTEGTNINLESLSNMQFAPAPNYTLTLQGLWTDVSCEYADLADLPVSWPPLYDVATKSYWRNITCPSEPQGFYQATVSESDNALHIYECPAPGGYDWNYYLHSYSNFSEARNRMWTDAYAGIGSMKCTVSPRLRNINTTFHSNLGAFTMSPADNVSQVPVLDVFAFVARYSWFLFSNAQLPYAGNSLAYVIGTSAVSRLGLPEGVKHPRYPGIVASMLKGVFEYQTTNFRLLLETSPNRAPNGCHRPVRGWVQYYVIGWDVALATQIGLAFVEALAVLMIVLMYYGQKGELTVFDPTNPVSLIAASSARGVSFGPESIGDPIDCKVRGVKVKYGLVNESGQWGLIMKPCHDISSVNGECGAALDGDVDNSRL